MSEIAPLRAYLGLRYGLGCTTVAFFTPRLRLSKKLLRLSKKLHSLLPSIRYIISARTRGTKPPFWVGANCVGPLLGPVVMTRRSQPVYALTLWSYCFLRSGV